MLTFNLKSFKLPRFSKDSMLNVSSVTNAAQGSKNGKSAKETKPYYFVRWRWWDRIDLTKVAEDFSKEFQVEIAFFPRDEMEFALRKDERDELKVRADTLTARLSVFRGVLYQRKSACFTQRDVKLRKMVLARYPKKRATPSSFPGLSEPEFEVGT